MPDWDGPDAVQEVPARDIRYSHVTGPFIVGPVQSPRARARPMASIRGNISPVKACCPSLRKVTPS
jgi:hypothetical protein